MELPRKEKHIKKEMDVIDRSYYQLPDGKIIERIKHYYTYQGANHVTIFEGIVNNKK